jgi:hypothetical protein
MLNHILSLQRNPNINNKNKFVKSNANQRFLINSLSHDTVSFGRCSIKSESFAESFTRQMRNLKLTNADVIQKSIKGKLEGEGENSKVYAISGIPDFVLSVPKSVVDFFENTSSDQSKAMIGEFIPETDPFNGENLGQSIGSIRINLPYKISPYNDTIGAKILVRVKGSQHSIENWPHYVTNQYELTHSHAITFLEKVEKISNMPDESYSKFAEKVKLLSENGYKMDSINPNNLLIHEKDINIVDYEKNCDIENSSYDMICSILDLRLFGKFHSLLDENEQKRLINAAKIVIEKSRKAAQKVNLTENKQTYIRYLNDADNIYSIDDHIKSYELLKKLTGL